MDADVKWERAAKTPTATNAMMSSASATCVMTISDSNVATVAVENTNFASEGRGTQRDKSGHRRERCGINEMTHAASVKFTIAAMIRASSSERCSSVADVASNATCITV